MGLDITSYSRLRFVRHRSESDPGEYMDRYVYLYDNPDFPEHLDEYQSGFYEQLPGSERMEFCAGSYGGYNMWRDILSKFSLDADPRTVWMNEELFQDRPFFELVHFSNCEGTIGTDTCTKLAKDFQDFAEKAERFAENLRDSWGGEWWLEKYREWQEALELATDGGFILFH